MSKRPESPYGAFFFFCRKYSFSVFRPREPGQLGSHGFPWFPWVPMGPHGSPWVPMGPHGFPWVPMGPHGSHGTPWGHHGVPMGPHVVPMASMENPRMSKIMDFNETHYSVRMVEARGPVRSAMCFRSILSRQNGLNRHMEQNIFFWQKIQFFSFSA